MRPILRILAALAVFGMFLASAWPQDGGAESDAGTTTRPVEEKPAEPEAADDGVLLQAVGLRGRIRDMRKTVLGGGPAVEKAEREALNFYRRKAQRNERRIDELLTTRDAKDAEYQLALDATLKARNEEARNQAAGRASALRTEIRSVEAEIEALRSQRKALENASSGIERRIQRRKRVLEHFDDTGETETMPFLGEDVLGPDDAAMVSEDPFADDEMLRDLLKRNPVKARKILLARDPVRYWKLFPLTPPESVLRSAIPFPPADLPGSR